MGTSTLQNITFRGATGPTGPTGVTGPTGPQGNTGATGPLDQNPTLESLTLFSGAPSLLIQEDNTSPGWELTSYNGNLQINNLTDSTDPDLALQINPEGNVGIGTAPDVWNTGTTALRIGSINVAAQNSGSTQRISLAANSYQSSGGAWEHHDSAKAALYLINDNGNAEHVWYRSTTSGGDTTWVESMRIDTNGQILINKNAQENAGKLEIDCGTVNNGIIIDVAYASLGYVGIQVNRSAADGDAIGFVRDTTNCGSISVTQAGPSTTYGSASDRRLKDNIRYIPDLQAAQQVMQLKPRLFEFISDPKQTVQLGFIADELQLVIPAAVTGVPDAEDDDGKPIYQMIDYGKITPILAAGLQSTIRKSQENSEEIQNLKKRIAELEGAKN